MPKLGTVAAINPSFDRRLLTGDDEEVSFVPMAAVSAESGSISVEEIRPAHTVLKGFTPFANNDVLVAKITPCFENGKIAEATISKRFGFGSTEFHVLRVDPAALNSRFLLHFLRCPRIRVEGERRMTGSGGQRRVPKAFLEALEIPLPPLPEQRRIAAILDKADALRANRRAAITRLDQLLQSVFLDMFGDPVTNPKGWPVQSFSRAVDFLTGFPFKSAQYLLPGKGVKLCRGTNVSPTGLDWSEEANWGVDDLDSLARYRIKVGDVVVAMDRPWISTGFKTVLISDEDPKCLLVQRVARLRPRAYFKPEFLFALMRSEAFKRHCRPTETTIPHISPNDFKSFSVIDPGARLIDQFESMAHRIKQQSSRYFKGLEQSDWLFDALQDQAFRTGETVVS